MQKRARMKGEIGAASSRTSSFSRLTRRPPSLPPPSRISFAFGAPYNQVHFSATGRKPRLVQPAETHHRSSRVSCRTFQVYSSVNRTAERIIYPRAVKDAGISTHALAFAVRVADLLTTVHLLRETPASSRAPSLIRSGDTCARARKRN